MILHGKDLLVYQTINGTTAVIAAAKSCDITINTETIEKTSPSTGQWKTYRPGRKDWSVGVSGLIPVTNGSIVTDLKSLLQETGEIVTLSFKLDANRYVGLEISQVMVCNGSAICKSVKVGASRGSLSTYSCDFRGSGELSFE